MNDDQNDKSESDDTPEEPLSIPDIDKTDRDLNQLAEAMLRAIDPVDKEMFAMFLAWKREVRPEDETVVFIASTRANPDKSDDEVTKRDSDIFVYLGGSAHTFVPLLEEIRRRFGIRPQPSFWLSRLRHLLKRNLRRKKK